MRFQKKSSLKNLKVSSISFRNTATEFQPSLKKLKQQMPKQTQITCQMDYSENYTYQYQNEISQVYYDKCQVTIIQWLFIMGTKKKSCSIRVMHV